MSYTVCIPTFLFQIEDTACGKPLFGWTLDTLGYVSGRKAEGVVTSLASPIPFWTVVGNIVSTVNLRRSIVPWVVPSFAIEMREATTRGMDRNNPVCRIAVPLIDVSHVFSQGERGTQGEVLITCTSCQSLLSPYVLLDKERSCDVLDT